VNGPHARKALVVAVLAFVAYVPALDAGFFGIDDPRFVSENESLRSFTPVRYFTEPGTSATYGHEGTYRPLRTLDFAIDHAIGGGRPFPFHLRNVLYHVLCSVLAYLLFVRLSADERRSGEGAGVAWTGALVFALHPACVESVAWITSRADGLLLALTLGVLLLHVAGRPGAAAGLLVAGLLAKEAAVVVPVLVVLVDRLRRAPPRWGRYGLYGGIALAYAVLWRVLMGSGGHLPTWWGGSYGANLLTMARGALAYVQGLLVPVGRTFDYHVPATTGLDVGAVLGILLLAGLGTAAALGGRRLRFVLGWTAVSILPTANLLFTVGIPTSDRFLYVPMVGVALGAGWLLHRTPLRFCVLVALLALTLGRAADWRSTDALFEANGAYETPRALDVRSHAALRRVRAAAKAGDRALAEEEARDVYAASAAMIRLYREEIGISPGNLGVRVLADEAEALHLTERYESALAAARRALGILPDARAHALAGYSCSALERPEEAASHLEAAIRMGYDERDLRPVAAGILNFLARGHAAEGRPEEALRCYRRSWRVLPSRAGNPEAAEALEAGGIPR
jgi:hypothetical protein